MISYCVQNLIFIVDSLVDFTDQLTKEWFLSSDDSCTLILGSMIAFITFWVIDGILAEFYFTWFQHAKGYVTGISSFNQTFALLNMQILLIVVIIVTFIQGIIRLLKCK